MSDSNDNTPTNFLTKRWGFIAGLCALPFWGLFIYLGDPGRGRTAGIAVGLLIIAARARWDLRKHIWFWVTLTVLAALQIPLVLLIPWSSKSYPGPVLLPVALVDYAFMYVGIKLSEMVMIKR